MEGKLKTPEELIQFAMALQQLGTEERQRTINFLFAEMKAAQDEIAQLKDAIDLRTREIELLRRRLASKDVSGKAIVNHSSSA